MATSDAEGSAGAGSDSLLGDSLAFLSSLLYAVYLVFLRRKIGNYDLNMAIFLGFVGFWSLILLWPGFLLLHYTGLEHFELPNSKTWLYLLTNSLAGTLISELLWLKASILTSPIISTLALRYLSVFLY